MTRLARINIFTSKLDTMQTVTVISNSNYLIWTLQSLFCHSISVSQKQYWCEKKALKRVGQKRGKMTESVRKCVQNYLKRYTYDYELNP